METSAPIDAAPSYRDEDLVYVDPETATVVGLVQWSNNGLPKSMAVPLAAADQESDKAISRRGRFRKYYPWGTYRSMKNVFKVAGKQKRKDPNHTLEEVLPRALSEAFWNYPAAPGAADVPAC